MTEILEQTSPEDITVEDQFTVFHMEKYDFYSCITSKRYHDHIFIYFRNYFHFTANTNDVCALILFLLVKMDTAKKEVAAQV